MYKILEDAKNIAEAEEKAKNVLLGWWNYFVSRPMFSIAASSMCCACTSLFFKSFLFYYYIAFLPAMVAVNYSKAYLCFRLVCAMGK